MKIRVTTDKREYQGLYYHSEHDAVEFWENEFGRFVSFFCMGKEWTLNDQEYVVVEEECRSSYCECEEGKCSGGKVDMRADEAVKVKAKGPIKSDGGSSTYYDIYLPEWLMKRMVEREVDGKVYIKTEEIIECFFESDFDFSNAFKSLIRAYGAFNGGGKAGNDVSYEVKKIQYSCDKIKDRFERKEKK